MEIKLVFFGILLQYPFDYAVSDDMVYAFITTPPVSEYFSDLVLDLRQQCFSLDILVNAIKYASFVFCTLVGIYCILIYLFIKCVMRRAVLSFIFKLSLILYTWPASIIF